jgi:Na+/H+ antiporter NhaD/arsenite permease-like protein
MKHLIVSLTIGACLLVPSAGMTLAGQAGTKAPVTKQPGTNAGVNCTTSTAANVGSAATAQGSPFNSISGTAGGVYANTFNGGGSSLSSNNLSATSQYDIACAQVP